MPLKKGKSEEAFRYNVSELMKSFKKKGKIGKSKPANTEEARKQALAIAFAQKRKKG